MLHEALLWEKADRGLIHCFLCAHHCHIADEHYGFCNVRQNRGGTLYTHSYGQLVAENIDPIEKKPLFHFLPGSRSYSIAAIGCNFRCAFCQNWQISQTKEAEQLGIRGHGVPPDDIVSGAVEGDCASISYTYTEPTIFMEYALDVAKRAKERGLANVFVTNGYMTKEALDLIAPYLDAANVDLKFFDDKSYRRVCAGSLDPVLDTIRRMREKKIWVEVTTLVIPGQNDSAAELERTAAFIRSVGEEVPWHLSLFHPDYRLTDTGYTPLSKLDEAYEIGKRAGLRYVYKGNIAAEANTFCYRCGERIIRRSGFTVTENRLQGSRCPNCSAVIDGVFGVKETVQKK